MPVRDGSPWSGATGALEAVREVMAEVPAFPSTDDKGRMIFSDSSCAGGKCREDGREAVSGRNHVGAKLAERGKPFPSHSYSLVCWVKERAKQKASVIATNKGLHRMAPLAVYTVPSFPLFCSALEAAFLSAHPQQQQ